MPRRARVIREVAGVSGEDKTRRDDANERADQLTRGIADLAEAALGVGVALGRTVADATARGRSVAGPPKDEGQIGQIIHYGVTIVRNVLGLVFSVAGSAADLAPGAGAARADAAPGPGQLPTVHQGGTLRIPLSVENPTAEPMTELVFRCRDIEAGALGNGVPVDGNDFRFDPPRLTIAARDFEKLTLYIDAASDAAPGRYRATLGVGDDSVQLSVGFEVRPG